jgi:alpha-tubulin suppressor-like RCC1 family protein
VQASAGGFFCLATKTDGTLWAWGRNEDGQLGTGNRVDRSSPVQVGVLTNWYQAETSTTRNSAAIKTDGTLWGWGFGQTGDIGDGNVISRSSPVQIGALTNWYQVSLGSNGAAAVKTNNTVWTWGSGSYGRLGDGTTVPKNSPVQVGALANWAQVAAGSFHTIASKTDGTLWVWGRNSYGQLGTNNVTNRSSPVQVGALSSWAQVAAGTYSSLAFTKG